MARRAKGEGSIYKRSDGLWCSKIIVGRSDDGKPKYKVFYGNKQSEVKKKLEEHKLFASTGVDILTKLCLDDYITTWLKTVKSNDLKPSSYDRASMTVKKHIIPYIGFYELKALTPELIQVEIINKMRDAGLSYSSIHKAYVYLNSCLKYAVRAQKLLRNPCDAVVLPSKDKFEKKSIRFFTDDEIAKFVTAATSKFKNGKLRFPYGYGYVLALYTGVRIGELIALRWDMVDMANRKIRIERNIVDIYDREEVEDEQAEKRKKKPVEQNNAKTAGSIRTIPLNEKAFSALMYMISTQVNGNDAFVLSKDNKPISVTNAIRGYQRICEFARIENYGGAHTLRHTFASLLFRKGVDVKTVSALLGHSDVAFTYNTYIHLIEEQKQTAVDLMNDV